MRVTYTKPLEYLKYLWHLYLYCVVSCRKCFSNEIILKITHTISRKFTMLYFFPFILEVQSSFISIKQIAFFLTLLKGDAAISLFYGYLPRNFLYALSEFILDCSFLYYYPRFCVGPCTRTSTELYAITTARCRFPLSIHCLCFFLLFLYERYIMHVENASKNGE